VVTAALFFSLALCAVASTTALADEVSYAPEYVSIVGGYTIPSTAIGTTGSGATLSGIYGRDLSAHLGFEINLQTSTFEAGSTHGSDLYQNGATGDLLYTPWDRRSDRFTPFALFGVGGAYDDYLPSSLAGASLLAEVGAGVVSPLLFGDRVRLRLDARYVHDFRDGGHSERRLMAGIEIPLGRVERHVEYLPGKVETREVIKEVVKEVERPRVDSDGDGVDDEHDQCPNTPKGLKVDAHGCVIEHQTIRLQGVNFEFNQARLTAAAQANLDEVAATFVGQPSLHAEVAGDTDTVGSAHANLQLSERRAQAVRAYLIAKGVQPERLAARGYGKTQPLVTPETNDLDRERNRRVELRFEAQ
jgi:OOP family OmpA-OmpF porin